MRQILNWFRRGKSGERPGPRIGVSHRPPRQRSGAIRSAGAGGAEAGHARTRRPHAGPGGSARRLADPLAAGFRVRPPLLRTVLSPQSVVYRHRRAFARARHWRNHRHLLSGRSGASCTRFRCASPNAWFSSTGKEIPYAADSAAYNLMSYPICRDLQLQDRFFEGVLCRAATTVNLSTGGEHKPAAAEIVSGSYFPVLGVSAGAGKGIEK